MCPDQIPPSHMITSPLSSLRQLRSITYCRFFFPNKAPKRLPMYPQPNEGKKEDCKDKLRVETSIIVTKIQFLEKARAYDENKSQQTKTNNETGQERGLMKHWTLAKQSSTVLALFKATETQIRVPLTTLSCETRPCSFFWLCSDRFRLLPPAHLLIFLFLPATPGWKMHNEAFKQDLQGNRPTYTTTTTN